MDVSTSKTDRSGHARTPAGTLVLVVGPSGAGKDTLIGEARRLLEDEPRIVFARRAITRPPGDPTEQHLAITPAEFAAQEARGEFLLSWPAHGLSYGIPVAYERMLDQGHIVVANVSRTVIREAERRIANVVVLHITAPIAILAARIAARGRERVDEIAERLHRQPPLAVSRAEVCEIVNDASIEIGARRIADLLKGLITR